MRLLLLPLCAALAACTPFPELEGAQTPGVAEAPWPDLLPLGPLLAEAAPPRATPEQQEGLETRASALRARAAGLQGPVVDAQTRARVAAGVPDPF